MGYKSVFLYPRLLISKSLSRKGVTFDRWSLAKMLLIVCILSILKYTVHYEKYQ